MIKKFDQYNESLRDKMTPVSGEDMRKLIGDDDIYENVYKVLVEKSKEFEPTFETEIKFASWSYDYISLYVKILNVRYIFRIEDGKWKTFYSWGRDDESRPKYFDTWDDAYQNMKVDIIKHFDRDLKFEKITLEQTQGKINQLEKTLKTIEEL